MPNSSPGSVPLVIKARIDTSELEGRIRTAVAAAKAELGLTGPFLILAQWMDATGDDDYDRKQWRKGCRGQVFGATQTFTGNLLP